MLYDRLVGGVERELIEQVLPLCDNVQVKAAARLGINRNTLHKKVESFARKEILLAATRLASGRGGGPRPLHKASASRLTIGFIQLSNDGPSRAQRGSQPQPDQHRHYRVHSRAEEGRQHGCHLRVRQQVHVGCPVPAHGHDHRRLCQRWGQTVEVEIAQSRGKSGPAQDVTERCHNQVEDPVAERDGEEDAHRGDGRAGSSG